MDELFQPKSQWDKTSFNLRIREYSNYYDVDNVNAVGYNLLKTITLYSDRESAINQDMFSKIKKILIECKGDQDVIAYLDENEIITIEFANGEIIKQIQDEDYENLFDTGL